MHTKTYQIEKTPQLKPELLVFLFNTISHSHLAPSVSDPFLVHLCLFPPHCFFIALLHLHSPYLTPSPVFFSSPCLFLPSFHPPPLSRAARETGISLTAGGESAPGNSPRWAKRVGVAWQTEDCVCLSRCMCLCVFSNNEHVTGTPH